MQNPHEQAQSALLSRIINNVENLNESVVAMNKSLQEINRRNLDIEIASQLWEGYASNAAFDLERTGDKTDPI
ncbi:DASH complex subunit dad4 [Yamadazyma tenuis]|uniref:DASH complex subunit DAD4 n=1 Tax=Candida tenuis (strain ATCC 10573 / BCRC 21748 / CBS 615 / JCM 9827 / NBRC 10315 / NRRL Y-1498 / VKM Y-70) TaxID=590646 RepID=G3B4F1_CANTC|nr:DASH complex, subunit Dad4 [Yamadazyma tenuis ATCC 10573]EGV63809.1 DASH complex, subunit Dad4 [Yamadazyma tenuis ATCC 10573]WEJ96583.1 DASH complex subunit dad4 [Yamadazyma tenuis]